LFAVKEGSGMSDHPFPRIDRNDNECLCLSSGARAPLLFNSGSR